MGPNKYNFKLPHVLVYSQSSKSLIKQLVQIEVPPFTGQIANGLAHWVARFPLSGQAPGVCLYVCVIKANSSSLVVGTTAEAKVLFFNMLSTP